MHSSGLVFSQDRPRNQNPGNPSVPAQSHHDGTSSGSFGSIFRVAGFGPTEPGIKVTLMVQEASGATEGFGDYDLARVSIAAIYLVLSGIPQSIPQRLLL